jgi:hypothetical protein
MSACSQCGTVVKPGDKFCNVCGTPIRAAAAPPAAPAYGASPAQPPYPPPAQAGPGGYGPPAAGPAPAHCQLGHEIAPGASYCAQGHPIALDQMQFANDAYNVGYGQTPAAQPFPGPRAASSPYATPPPPPAYPAPGIAPYNAPPQAAYAAAYAPMPQPGPQPPAAYARPPQPYAPPPAAPAYAPFPGDAPREAVPAKVLRGFLVTYGTNPSGEFWPLTAGRLTVGRYGSGDGLDIPLQDPTISSRHGVLAVDGASGTISIEDTGSTNGTFVNDEHIGYGGRRDLRDGDRVRFGGFTTVVKVIGRV